MSFHCFTTVPRPHDYCASTPCDNGGVCDNQHNGYICHCKESFTGINCTQGNSE